MKKTLTIPGAHRFYSHPWRLRATLRAVIREGSSYKALKNNPARHKRKDYSEGNKTALRYKLVIGLSISVPAAAADKKLIEIPVFK